jgi:putative nucleotidyltransferase with HDIG domain
MGHFLLPEPTGAEACWQPLSYASTGLPLFIDAMIREGAAPRTMEACVAGGALVGPVCESDLELDIGGRTADVVERILRDRGIPASKAETGGFFTCRLALNLENLETEISPLGPQYSRAAGERFTPPSSETLDASLEAVRPIPQVALKIIRMIRNQAYDMEDIAEETRRDQVISAKVIRLCNSPRFGMKLDAIDRALVMVGERHLLQFILSAALDDFFPEAEKGGYSLCKGGLYKHALGTAMTAENLARYTGRVEPDIAYTAGLLHDIGKVVLDQYIAAVAPLFYRRTQVEGYNLIDVEKEAFGMCHTEAGHLLAERWGLPRSLAEAIRCHHSPEQASVNPDLTHVIYVADLLMSRFMAGHELERMDTSMLAEGLTRLGIPLQDFPAVVDCMPRRSDSGAVMDHRVDSTGGSDPPGNFEGVAKSPLPSYLP